MLKHFYDRDHLKEPLPKKFLIAHKNLTNNFFEFSDVSQSIHKDGFWQSVM